MPPKRLASSKLSAKDTKRQKRVMTLEEKVEVLNMMREGRSFAEVGRHFAINESTVRYIKKNEAEIRRTVSSSICGQSKTLSRVRSKALVRMESALAVWIRL